MSWSLLLLQVRHNADGTKLQWQNRPLTNELITCAAADVAYLIPVMETQVRGPTASVFLSLKTLRFVVANCILCSALASPGWLSHSPPMLSLLYAVSGCAEPAIYVLSLPSMFLNIPHAVVSSSNMQVRSIRSIATEVRQQFSQQRRAALMTGLPDDIGGTSVLESLAAGVEGQQRGGLSMAKLGDWAALSTFHQVC